MGDCIDVSAGRELDSGVEARRPSDPPVGAPDMAGRSLVGIAPREVEVVDAAPAVATGQGEVARVRGRVIVDADGLVAGAADVAREVSRAVTQAVAAVAETAGVDCRAARDAGEAGLHLCAPPFAADRRPRAGILGERPAIAVEQGFAKADPPAPVAAREGNSPGAAGPAARGQVTADPGAGPTIVLDGDCQRPQRRPRVRFDAARLAFGAGAEQADLQGRLGGGKAGDEAARGHVRASGAEARVEAAPRGAEADALLHPVL